MDTAISSQSTPLVPPFHRWRRSGFVPSAGAVLVLWLALHLGLFRDLPVLLWLPSLAGLVAGTGLVVMLLPRRYPHPAFGWCNAVTLTRLGLALTLLTPLVAGSPAGWTVAAVAGVALALDGVDGWLARRHHRASDFGARFDMEVDSVLALLLALNAMAAGQGGAVVLVLGFARYVYVVAGWVLPWLNGPLPERYSRKAVCVLQIGALIALQLPLWPAGVAVALAWGAALAVLWSFAVDIRWLARRRG